jgi:hypothetical protein
LNQAQKLGLDGHAFRVGPRLSLTVVPSIAPFSYSASVNQVAGHVESAVIDQKINRA